jgi:hypothetical protein
VASLVTPRRESKEWAWPALPSKGKPETSQQWFTWVLAWLGAWQFLELWDVVADWLIAWLGW